MSTAQFVLDDDDDEEEDADLVAEAKKKRRGELQLAAECISQSEERGTSFSINTVEAILGGPDLVSAVRREYMFGVSELFDVNKRISQKQKVVLQRTQFTTSLPSSSCSLQTLHLTFHFLHYYS